MILKSNTMGIGEKITKCMNVYCASRDLCSLVLSEDTKSKTLLYAQNSTQKYNIICVNDNANLVDDNCFITIHQNLSQKFDKSLLSGMWTAIKSVIFQKRKLLLWHLKWEKLNSFSPILRLYFLCSLHVTVPVAVVTKIHLYSQLWKALRASCIAKKFKLNRNVSKY